MPAPDPSCVGPLGTDYRRDEGLFRTVANMRFVAFTSTASTVTRRKTQNSNSFTLPASACNMYLPCNEGYPALEPSVSTEYSRYLLFAPSLPRTGAHGDGRQAAQLMSPMSFFHATKMLACLGLGYKESATRRAHPESEPVSVPNAAKSAN